MTIDFEGLDQRIVALPIERANYAALETGAEGILFLVANPTVITDEDYSELEEAPPQTAFRFDLGKRKTEKLLEKIDGGNPVYGGLTTFVLSSDGNKMLFSQGKKWFLTDSEKTPAAGDGELKSSIEVYVDPRAEWRQMYREVWRLERDFLYAPNFHGLDLKEAERVYAPFVEGIAAREDLNQLFREMTGHLVLGHTFVGGGAQPKQEEVAVGLLGADYRVVSGRYQFARILSGENWNPKLQAPLTQPGVAVAAGEFLLAVNGQELRGDDDVSRLFQGTAGKQTVLTVGPQADGARSRQVTVVPVKSEEGLRLRTWMDDNRRRVDELTGGRVAYVYIPDTGAGGFENFNRYFFSQVGKKAVIVDERFNHGGSIADYIVDYLKRTPQMAVASREGEDVVEPVRGDLRAEGDDRQPDVGLGRRRPALALPQGRPGAARGRAHLGRAGGHRRLPAAARRRLRHGAALGSLRNEGRVGSREHRDHARHRGRAGSRPGTPGSRPAARESGRGRARTA